jgi:hypothetical protein
MRQPALESASCVYRLLVSGRHSRTTGKKCLVDRMRIDLSRWPVTLLALQDYGNGAITYADDLVDEAW